MTFGSAAISGFSRPPGTYGLNRVRFVCRWDGPGEDGLGGAAQMYQELE